ncbi:MAG: hypothetical protein ACJA2P_000598 [Rhodoferax sp.]|jgi:hypothetical protein
MLNGNDALAVSSLASRSDRSASRALTDAVRYEGVALCNVGAFDAL